MNAARPAEHRHGVPLDDDPDLHRLSERGQVEYAVHRLVERSGGLDDEIVQARLGRVERDAGHDVGQADRCVAAGELRVGETAAVGQQVQRKAGRDPLAVLQQADERVRVQRRLAAGQAERPRIPREQNISTGPSTFVVTSTISSPTGDDDAVPVGRCHRDSGTEAEVAPGADPVGHVAG